MSVFLYYFIRFLSGTLSSIFKKSQLLMRLQVYYTIKSPGLMLRPGDVCLGVPSCHLIIKGLFSNEFRNVG